MMGLGWGEAYSDCCFVCVCVLGLGLGAANTIVTAVLCLFGLGWG